MKEKLAQIQIRFEELERLLQDGSLVSDQQKMQTISQEYDSLKKIIANKKQLEKVQQDLDCAE